MHQNQKIVLINNTQSYILKQQWCLSVWAVPGKFFQGSQGRHLPTSGHFQLRLEKQQWWCLFVWAVPGKIFQSLHTPCGASPNITDSREKINQGQFDFLRQKIW
jgi:hypothetical protein